MNLMTVASFQSVETVSFLKNYNFVCSRKIPYQRRFNIKIKIPNIKGTSLHLNHCV